MRRTMREGDGVRLTLAGQTHEFGPDKVRVQVDETGTRGGDKVRYATLVVQLDGEFPEDLSEHLARVAETG